MKSMFDKAANLGDRPPRSATVNEALQEFRPSGLPLLILLLLGFFVFVYSTCPQYISPDEFAVKQVDVPVPLLTGAAGIHTNIYGTGIQWRVPGCEKFLIFPKSVRAVTLHGEGKITEEHEKFVRFEEAAHIQTLDLNKALESFLRK
jgi:hypothetical protein